MKILCGYDHFQGNLNHGYEGYIEALRALGHEVPESFDMGNHLKIPRDGYDWFLQFDCSDNYAPPPLNYFSVYWAYDNWQNYKNNRDSNFVGDGSFCRDQQYYVPRARMSNLVFSMSRLGVQNYQAHGITSCFLPIGADERLERKPGSVKKELEIATICNFWHMGHLDNRRGSLIKVIQDAGINPNAMSNRVDYFKQADIYANAKIGWNYSPCGFDVLNYRVWETMISGTCLLTNENTIPTLSMLGYIEGKDFVAYKDDEVDLLRKIKWLLDDDSAREEIARHGYAKTRKANTMHHRMQMMCEMVERRLKKQ